MKSIPNDLLRKVRAEEELIVFINFNFKDCFYY